MPSISLQQLQDELRATEQEIDLKSSQMGRLKSEYTHNRSNIKLAYHQRVQPYTTATFQSLVYQQELETRIAWLSEKVITMEKRTGGGASSVVGGGKTYSSNALPTVAGFVESRDMADYRRSLFDELRPLFQEVFVNLESITKDELAVLRSYDTPPQAVYDTVLAVMRLRGEPEPVEWEGSKVLFSESYYFSFFIRKAQQQYKLLQLEADATYHRAGRAGTDALEEGDVLSPAQVDALAAVVMNPDLSPEAVSQVSRPCGIFAAWINAVYRFQLLTDVTYPGGSGTTLEEVRGELRKRREELIAKKEDIAGAEATLRGLEEELEEKLEELRVRYDDAMLPLQDLFFDASKRFNETYSSPRRQREAARVEGDHNAN